MYLAIEPQPKGWVIVETKEFAINIHRDTKGLAGELRDAALRVHELLGLIEAEEKDGKGQEEKGREGA